MSVFNAQSGLSDLAAVFARSGAMAATQVMARAASLGLLLWSDVLAAAVPAPRPAQPEVVPAEALPLALRFSPMSWLLQPRPEAASFWPGTGLSTAAAWTPMAGWAAWSRAWNLPSPETALAPPTAMPLPTIAAPGYSSYRSAGGHASAQVVMGSAERQAP